MKLLSAAGIDNITSKILKKHDLTSAIPALLFPQSLSSAHVPIDCKIEKITPVLKSGIKASPLSYRPISLTSTPLKIMKHFIFTYITNHLERNHCLYPSQRAFGKGLPCEAQLAAFIRDLHFNLYNNTQTDAILLDLEKNV